MRYRLPFWLLLFVILGSTLVAAQYGGGGYAPPPSGENTPPPPSSSSPPSSQPAPQITNITPSAAPNNATIDLTINGNNFVSGLSVTLQKTNSITGTNVLVTNAQQVIATFDIRNQPTGAWRVVVVNPDQQQAIFDSFNIGTSTPANTGGSGSDNTTIGPAPSVVAVTPNATANDNNNFRILIKGANFDAEHGADVAAFLSQGENIVLPVEQEIIDSRTIVATFDMTGVPTGAWDVEVDNPDNQFAKLRGGVSVVGGPKTGLPSLLQRFIPASFRPYVNQLLLSHNSEEQPTEQAVTAVEYKHSGSKRFVDKPSPTKAPVVNEYEPIIAVEPFDWLRTIIVITRERLSLFADKLVGLFTR